MKAVKELWQAFLRYPLWTRLAFTDIKETYKRSVIGGIWIFLSFGMFIGAKILVFGSFIPSGSTAAIFTAHLTVGFWLWTFIQENVTDGSTVFVKSRNWILGTYLPQGIFVFQSTFRTILRALFSLPVVIIILIMGNWTPTYLWWTSLLGLAIFLINAVWVHILLGILCSKHRDLAYFLQSVMRVMFFLTPILYLPEMLGERAYLLDYNPFTHYLAIVRDPIISGFVPVLAWQVVTVITVAGGLVSIIVSGRMGRRVAFWV